MISWRRLFTSDQGSPQFFSSKDILTYSYSNWYIQKVKNKLGKTFYCLIADRHRYCFLKRLRSAKMMAMLISDEQQFDKIEVDKWKILYKLYSEVPEWGFFPREKKMITYLCRDWVIIKSDTTGNFPYCLEKDDKRFNCFKNLKTAKIAAHLLDFG